MFLKISSQFKRGKIHGRKCCDVMGIVVASGGQLGSRIFHDGAGRFEYEDMFVYSIGNKHYCVRYCPFCGARVRGPGLNGLIRFMRIRIGVFIHRVIGSFIYIKLDCSDRQKQEK